MKHVAVIGGGASGFAAAITIACKSKDFTVTIYEKLQKPLKKILATGNGHCNLTNAKSQISDYYGDTDFAQYALETYPPQSNLCFFEHMGLLTKADDAGRVYPASGQAASVRDILLAEAEKCGVQICTETAIQRVEKTASGFLLNEEILCDRLLLCAGGAAGEKHGTCGDSFRLLQMLGHAVVTPAPALTALTCRDFPKSLKGVRHVCAVTLTDGKKEIHRALGEVQFTDYGLSGIPMMQLSRWVAVRPNVAFTVKLDCFTEKSETALADFLKSRLQIQPNSTAQTMMMGILPQALGNALLLRAGIKKDCLLHRISTSAIDRLAAEIKALSFSVSGVRGFDFAQVTAGGADCAEFEPKTMASKKVPHFYACGEALNVDGGCGGYNLQWAWSSGRCAGDAIVKENAN